MRVDNNSQLNNSFTVNKIIDGEFGGTLTTNQEFKKGDYNSISVKATIKFPGGAFQGKINISMTNNLDQCLTTFAPSITFNKEAIFNITYKGVDLTKINQSTLSFAYIANDGSIQFAAYDKIELDPSTGTLSVTNAKIPHFSRYGFVNRIRTK